MLRYCLSASLLFSLIFFFLALTGGIPSQASANEWRISADFENGALGGWRVDEDGYIELRHAPGAGEIWYHFRLDGVRGQHVRFVFPRARNDHFGGANLPVYSYDQVHWAYVSQRNITPYPGDPTRVRFEFEQTFSQDRVWLAYAPPFTNTLLDQITREVAEHPNVETEILCLAPKSQRPIPIFTIESPAEPKQTLLALGREDACETAGSWLAWGMMRFLLSGDIVADAIKRKARFLILPIFDVDGVAEGSAVHPFPLREEGVFWTETWPETLYSFYEQRQMKEHLQAQKDRGIEIDYAFRLHSEAWSGDRLRREHAAEISRATQDALFIELFEELWLPWYDNTEGAALDTRFSKVVFDLFPTVITGMIQSDWLYPGAFHPDFPLHKTTEDFFIEGELFVRALAEKWGITDPNPPPYLHGARVFELSERENPIFAAHCVYRDLLGRPPEYVRITINETQHELQPVSTLEPDYAKGVLYAGFIPVEGRDNVHFFSASNGSRETRSPQVGIWPGPYWLGDED